MMSVRNEGFWRTHSLFSSKSPHLVTKRSSNLLSVSRSVHHTEYHHTVVVGFSFVKQNEHNDAMSTGWSVVADNLSTLFNQPGSEFNIKQREKNYLQLVRPRPRLLVRSSITRSETAAIIKISKFAATKLNDSEIFNQC